MALKPVPALRAPLPKGGAELPAHVRTPGYEAFTVLIAPPYLAIKVVLAPAAILTALAEMGVITTGSTTTVKPTEFPGHPGTKKVIGHTVVACTFLVPEVFNVVVTLELPPALLVGDPSDGPLGATKKFVAYTKPGPPLTRRLVPRVNGVD